MNDSRTKEEIIKKDDNNMLDEIYLFLNNNVSSSEIFNNLRSIGKSERFIETFISKYEYEKDNIIKAINKFINKISKETSGLESNADLYKIAIKFVSKISKFKSNPQAREFFLRNVLKRDFNSKLMMKRSNYSDMSKFLGFPGETMDYIPSINPKEAIILRKCYEDYMIHKDFINEMANFSHIYDYRSLLSSEITFDRHKVEWGYVHPLIAALFIPKINLLEDLFIKASILRIIIHKTRNVYDNNGSFNGANRNLGGANILDMTSEDFHNDMKLAINLANDPNNANNVMKNSPIIACNAKQEIQISLLHNIRVLRLNGRVFFNKEVDSIASKLIDLLVNYDGNVLDSPDMIYNKEEGFLLRQLLSVVGARPTIAKLAPIGGLSLVNDNLTPISRVNIVNIAVCNIRLPDVHTINTNPNLPFNLNNAINQPQHDSFIEGKSIVVKHKIIVCTNDVIFFYVCRRFQSINYQNVDMGFRFFQVPGTSMEVNTINTKELSFDHNIVVGGTNLSLRSVVVANKLFNGRMSSGCSSIIVCPPENIIGRTDYVYFYYNPSASLIPYKRGDVYDYNKPLSPIPSYSISDRIPGFFDLARTHGTIFTYSVDSLIRQF